MSDVDMKTVEDEVMDHDALTAASAPDLGSVLAVRRTTHGEYSEHARIAQRLKTIMRNTANYPSMNEYEAETLDMIAHKIGRILAGDPHYHDHWLDIAGYASLTANRNAPRGS
jgi:hypothetical protein